MKVIFALAIVLSFLIFPLVSPRRMGAFAPSVNSQLTPQANGVAKPLFPPGLVPEGRASGGTYGRNANEVVFILWPEPGTQGKPKILVSRKTASGWSQPIPALPEIEYWMAGPSVSADGKLLYFETSHREPPVSGRQDSDLWVAERKGETWGRARPLGPPFDSPYNEHNVTVSARGTICINSSRPGGLGGNDIYCSVRVNGKWEEPRNLGATINSAATDGAVYLDPQERYLLFGSNRRGGQGNDDLYISVKRNGQWQAPVNLGATVNTADSEWAPAVSPDGKRLLFTREVGRGAAAKVTMHEVPFDEKWLQARQNTSARANPGPHTAN